MNLSIISSNENYDLCFLRKNKWSYFISIPKDKYNNFSICVNFRNDTHELDILTNDLSDIKQKIYNICNPLEKTVCILVIPMLEEKHIIDFKKLSIDNYDRVFIANVINDAYKYLIGRNYKIDDEVIVLNDNQFSNFVLVLDQMFKNSILVKTVYELQKEHKYYEVVREPSEIKLMDANGVNIVVGTEGVVEKKESSGKVIVIAPDKNINYITRTVGPTKREKKDTVENELDDFDKIN